MKTSHFNERLDDMCRILIDADARKILNWGYNTRLCYFINTLANTVVLSKSANGTLEIDQLGRVALPIDMLKQVSWGAGDIVNAQPKTCSNSLWLSMGKRSCPKCALCERQEKIITINNKDVCKHCAAEIARVRL